MRPEEIPLGPRDLQVRAADRPEPELPEEVRQKGEAEVEEGPPPGPQGGPPPGSAGTARRPALGNRPGGEAGRQGDQDDLLAEERERGGQGAQSFLPPCPAGAQKKEEGGREEGRREEVGHHLDRLLQEGVVAEEVEAADPGHPEPPLAADGEEEADLEGGGAGERKPREERQRLGLGEEAQEEGE